MRVAVTGSHGLIGSALVRSLRDDGHAVVRLVRGPAEALGDVRWDPRAGTIDADALRGIDAAVHLAGAGIGNRRWTPGYKREVLESRTLSTDLLARTLASLDPPPRVLVSGSAVGYYGSRGDEVLIETSRAGSGFLADVCVRWEGAAAPAREAGIRVAAIRTGMVLAGRGGALAKLLPLFRLGLGGRMGSGRQWWSWITLHDHVRAMRWLVEHEVGGPVNLTAPAPVTNHDFTRALAATLHRPAFAAVPRLAPRVLLGRELADQLLFSSQRAVPSVLNEHGFHFEHPDIEAALAAVVSSGR